MNAGVDLVLLSHTTLLSGEAAKAAAEALQSGKLDRKEVEESVTAFWPPRPSWPPCLPPRLMRSRPPP